MGAIKFLAWLMLGSLLAVFGAVFVLFVLYVVVLSAGVHG